ncbi:hypothetical protein GCM10023322_42640 [Rugosimonospora acidiphila]|uniref:Preprotein translocase YidC n=1 Tax=Rugosimonospora acidiphila TaxID=556531 RepID=A0ABP9RZK2_9ACTN
MGDGVRAGKQPAERPAAGDDPPLTRTEVEVDRRPEGVARDEGDSVVEDDGSSLSGGSSGGTGGTSGTPGHPDAAK